MNRNNCTEYTYDELDHYLYYLDEKHRENGCEYGTPDESDNVINECSCKE